MFLNFGPGIGEGKGFYWTFFLVVAGPILEFFVFKLPFLIFK
jgi:hypothetical protein